MKRFALMDAVLAISLFCTAGVQIAAAEKTSDPNSAVIREAKEFTVRGGLPNFYKKLAEGKPVKIAYLGGSITQQKGWRVQSLDYFRKLYPKAKVDEIYAAIGGTGSTLGAFRLDYDVLRFKPDLLFIEFAVNDSWTSPLEIRRAMEGIIRHTWREFPETDICIVYTITVTGIKDLLNGRLTRSASVMEDVADYYQVPSVHFGLGVAQLLRENKLVMKADSRGMTVVSGEALNISSKVPMTAYGKMPFSKDGVHPYLDTGHVLYTNALKKALPEIAKAGRPGSHLPLPPPAVKNNYEFTKVIPLDAPGVKLSGKVTKLSLAEYPSETAKTCMPGLWKLEPGASLEFKFKGTKAMLYSIYGPGTGSAEITVDGNKPYTVNFFDPYCGYYRVVSPGIPYVNEDKLHTVRITVLDRPFDKRAILAKRKIERDFDKNPKKYAERNLYIGAILMFGEPVK